MLAATLAAPAASFASGPLAGWWPMNEGQGQTIHDWSGNKNHGTLGTTPGVDDQDPTWTTGMFGGTGRALFFDNQDLITVADDPSLEPSRITVSTWVRADDSPGAFQYIVAKGSDACEAASYGLYTGRQGGVAFYIYDGEDFYVSPEMTTLWNNAWHNVAGTFDGKKVRLYVDGRQVGSGTAVPAGTSISYPLADGGGSIGGYPDTACALSMRGDIDTVRIWNQALPVDLYWALFRSLLGRS